jgi:hypothetical protein
MGRLRKGIVESFGTAVSEGKWPFRACGSRGQKVLHGFEALARLIRLQRQGVLQSQEAGCKCFSHCNAWTRSFTLECAPKAEGTDLKASEHLQASKVRRLNSEASKLRQ